MALGNMYGFVPYRATLEGEDLHKLSDYPAARDTEQSSGLCIWLLEANMHREITTTKLLALNGTKSWSSYPPFIWHKRPLLL